MPNPPTRKMAVISYLKVMHKVKWLYLPKIVLYCYKCNTILKPIMFYF